MDRQERRFKRSRHRVQSFCTGQGKSDRDVNIGADAVSGRNYVHEIIDGIKKMETRTTKGATSKNMFHKWMAIIDTSRQNYDEPMIIGYAKFGEPVDLSDPSTFDDYRDQTRIDIDDEYDLKPEDKVKWGYPFEDVMKNDPRPLFEGTRMNNRNKFFENVQDEMMNGVGFEMRTPKNSYERSKQLSEAYSEYVGDKSNKTYRDAVRKAVSEFDNPEELINHPLVVAQADLQDTQEETILDESPERAALREEWKCEILSLGSYSGEREIDGKTIAAYNVPIRKDRIAFIITGPSAAGKSSVLANPISQQFGA